MTSNRYFIYLEKLRRSGETNMYGAAPYLMREFHLKYSEAITILIDWMTTYNPEDYKEVRDDG